MTNKNTDYTCLHEEQIQSQSRKIERLETRVDYKSQRIDELNHNMEIMNNKIDELLKIVNQQQLDNKQADNELELRLKNMETEIKLLKKENKLSKETIKENRARTQQLIAIITVIFVGLTFYFNYIH